MEQHHLCAALLGYTRWVLREQHNGNVNVSPIAMVEPSSKLVRYDAHIHNSQYIAPQDVAITAQVNDDAAPVYYLSPQEHCWLGRDFTLVLLNERLWMMPPLMYREDGMALFDDGDETLFSLILTVLGYAEESRFFATLIFPQSEELKKLTSCVSCDDLPPIPCHELFVVGAVAKWWLEKVTDCSNHDAVYWQGHQVTVRYITHPAVANTDPTMKLTIWKEFVQ